MATKLSLIDFNPETGRMGEPKDIDLAWCAGFIDGEGCISIVQDRGRYTASINVGQVHRAPLDRLQAIMGIGSVGPIRDDFGGHFQWRVYSDNAAYVAELLLPYLFNKSKQAKLLLEFQGTKGHTGKRVTDDIGDKQTEYFLQVKTLNVRRKRLDAERLSEKAPAELQDEAIVRPHRKQTV